MTVFDADVIVVGLGAWGSSALWRLAERGVNAIGIERYGLGHEYGSSHGATRLFRLACLEHPGLVPVARRAGELWRELERRTGEELLRITGGIMIGPPDGRTVAGTLAAARAHDLPVEELDAAALRARFPQHAGVPDDFVGVWDPNAGAVRPELGVNAACRAAVAAGARVYADTRVSGVELIDGGAVVTTPARVFRARQVVVTAGPWLGKLVPDLPLDVRRTPMMWFSAKEDPEAFAIDRFPVFIRHLDDDTSIWGHGSVYGHEVKVGLEDAGDHFASTDPDECDRGITPRDHGTLSRVLRTAVPGLDPAPARAIACMITNSPDAQFMIGRPRRDPRLIVGGGCTGHGFKHATAVGEAIAQLAVGEETFCDLSFTDPNRFL
ncbi:N-methyl-L-tryptophan oxidase [Nonomuraea sp. NPDC046570]|uniref:N-methyl-L-tryptophan oxidase n=1 Tax=Nonomuraea sp. NPDC046570 TaxID=3155255 RepID=UPI0033CF59A8